MSEIKKRQSLPKNLKLRIIVSLEDQKSDTTLTLVGERMMFEGSYSHQMLSAIVLLACEIFTKQASAYIHYLTQKCFKNETFTHDYAAMRMKSQAHVAATMAQRNR